MFTYEHQGKFQDRNSEHFLLASQPWECAAEMPTSGSAILEIRAPKEGERIRKVVSRSRMRPTGKYPSQKMARMVQWESPNELAAIRLLDADPEVTAFSEQPFSISSIMNAEVRRHVPDLLVHRAGRKELWEIKASPEHLDQETKQRTKLLTEALVHHGFDYRLVFGADLKRGPQISNALALLRLGRGGISIAEREQVRCIFADLSSVTWGDAVTGLLGQRGSRILSRLFLDGVVGFDLQTPLSLNTEFYWIDVAGQGRA